jgi:hypothetical protein
VPLGAMMLVTPPHILDLPSHSALMFMGLELTEFGGNGVLSNSCPCGHEIFQECCA